MKPFCNGASKEKSRRHQDSRIENIRETVELSKIDCGNNGDEPNRANKQDCRGGNISHASAEPIGGHGKILDRLKFLQTEYLTYLSDHRERLKTRLEENLQKEESFCKSIKELEHEILELISESDNDPIKPS